MTTPVVLFMFKRKDTLLQIIDRVRMVNPSKVYLVSDQGRNAEEKELVKTVRNAAEAAIDWDCEIIKDYAELNRGVYENIGLGALRVFENESRAIFLEDDNLPEITFFQYCENLLDLYEKDDKILWICGTNYYESIDEEENYFFTQHLLPCGWASWGDKFKKYYDKDLSLLNNKNAMRMFRDSYENHTLYKQRLRDIMDEKNRKKSGKSYASWDYHMLLSIRAQDLLGIVPSKNQIKNIGVDAFSIHGGASMDMIMTSRFCQVGTKPFDFPIKKLDVSKNPKVERLLECKIVYPFKLRIKGTISRIVRKLFGIPEGKSIKEVIHIGRLKK